MHPTGNLRILDRLVADGVITTEQRERAANVVQSRGERFEEALIELSAVDEARLLKYLALLHKTRFVSTEKLAKAEIDRVTLDRVPRRLAEQRTVFPVLFDAKQSVLSVVTPDPDDAPALHEVQLASGAREVKAFVGRPRAVKAAIAKAYAGDIHAFANVDRAAQEQFTTMLNIYERNLVSEESIVTSVISDDSRRERMLNPADLEPGAQTVSVSGSSKSLLTTGYLETLNVLITLLENGRADLRGHSAQVARLMRKFAERIGLSETQRDIMISAGYLHDLGKAGTYHLTALNVAEYDGHRTAAGKGFSAPRRLLEPVGLPREVTEAIERMYERYDGKGLPDGVSGRDIPLGARLLAIADTYADLTHSARNPFRRVLQPAEACDVLARYRSSVFDPNLVDLFKHVVSGEDLKARLLSNRQRALVIDPDPEETTVIELRLLEQGFEVQQAHGSEQAFKLLEGGEFDIVVSELELKPMDGLALLAEVRRRNWGKKLPWIFVSARSSRAEAQQAFDLGAADYMTKPVSPDLLVAKSRQIIEREAAGRGRRGAAGSLREMGLPDVIQVLWHGRKTAALRIRANGSSGEIHFVNGEIFNAMWSNVRGEEAFYAMLALTDGEFVLDPEFEASQRVISESVESLLLEGMRRVDERGT
jgi:response regulator RpfG family c-di-GMP phosphodiesterase